MQEREQPIAIRGACCWCKKQVSSLGCLGNTCETHLKARQRPRRTGLRRSFAGIAMQEDSHPNKYHQRANVLAPDTEIRLSELCVRVAFDSPKGRLLDYA